MKKTFTPFVTLLMIALAINSSVAQNPTYNLTAKNFVESPFVVADMLEWDIYLEVTGNGPMEYAGGQYFFSFSPAIFPCPVPPSPFTDTTNMRYRVIGSDLPSNMQPRNPSIRTATSPNANVLALAVNTFPGAGNGVIMNVGFPGTKIARMLLHSKCGLFIYAPMNLTWRNPPVVAFSTKIFAYLGTANTDITTPNTHTVLCNPLSCPISSPVELTSFSSSVNRNNVTLHWTTAGEINNQGFDIERKLTSSEDWAKVNYVAGNGTTSENKNYTFRERVNTGNYNYRLKQIDFNGNFEYFNLSNEVEVGVPSVYAMSQNYPNPFNPTTKIDYDLPYDGKVSIILYDISGREVANLVNEVKTAGYYTLQFNASNLASGMYFYRITAQGGSNNFVMTKKMVLIK